MSPGLVGILIEWAQWNNSLGQPVFTFTSEYRVLSGEAVHVNFIFDSLSFYPTGLESTMIYIIWGEHINHNTTHVVSMCME